MGSPTPRSIAMDVYKTFSSMEGNQHIASEYAIERILWLMTRYRIERVLEIGLGIGSISCAVAEACRQGLLPWLVDYVGTEANEFCLNALSSNFEKFDAEVTIYPNLASVPEGPPYGLAIIDGRDPDLIRINRLLQPEGGAVVIEGDRQPQVAELRDAFGDVVYFTDISARRNPPYGPFPASYWAGGCQVIFVRPTPSQRLIALSSRIRTGIRYRYRTWAGTHR